MIVINHTRSDSPIIYLKRGKTVIMSTTDTPEDMARASYEFLGTDDDFGAAFIAEIKRLGKEEEESKEKRPRLNHLRRRAIVFVCDTSPPITAIRATD